MTTYRVGGATVFISKDFGSQNTDHRPRLRTALKTQIEIEARNLALKVDAGALEKIEDPSAPPRLGDWGLSVSHCPDIGGFALKPNSPPIGFDLEVVARLSPAIVRRIAASEGEREILATAETDPMIRAYFWCAKEAAIKVCGHTRIETALHHSNVEILSLDIAKKIFSARGHFPDDAIEISGEIFDVNSGEIVAALAFSDRLKSRH